MDLRRLALLTLITGLAIVSAAIQVAASDSTAVMAPLHQFMDALNKGDNKTAVAACASPASIVDDFPPHEWQGPTACGDWVKAFDADNKSAGITDGIVTLKKPWHVDVTGDRAYVVIPADFAYVQGGKPVTEAGSIWTVALRRTAAGWRITGWAWADR
jgi:hypothetical protein